MLPIVVVVVVGRCTLPGNNNINIIIKQMRCIFHYYGHSTVKKTQINTCTLVVSTKPRPTMLPSNAAHPSLNQSHSLLFHLLALHLLNLAVRDDGIWFNSFDPVPPLTDYRRVYLLVVQSCNRWLSIMQVLAGLTHDLSPGNFAVTSFDLLFIHYAFLVDCR